MNEPDQKRNPRRVRWAYALASGAVIALGLWSRSDAVGLSPFVAKYAGDALWGLVVFIGIAFLLPRRSTGTVAWPAVAFTSAVEFGQLFHAPWLDAIRATTPGALVLGTPASTFAVADIVAYLIGITFGIAVERLLWRRPLATPVLHPRR